MKTYQILPLVTFGLVAALLPAKILAQSPTGTFPNTNISCNSPWSGTAHTVDMGEIADPASVSVPIKDVPIDINCESSGFVQNVPGEWTAHGATCLAIDVTSGSASMRKLTHKTDASAPQINFNFSSKGITSPASAVGNAMAGQGLGVTYFGESTGANNSATGPDLNIGGQVNDLGINIHSTGQPSNLPSGDYEGTFTWKFYAGTADFIAGLPSEVNCAATVGQGSIMQGTITVKVNVKKSCSMELPQPGNVIDFGKLTSNDLVSGFGPITRHLQISCNNNNDMFVTIGAGQNSGGNINNRHMKLDGGTELIKYSLTKPGGGEWGDSPSTGSGYQISGSFGTTRTVDIEARILPHSGGLPTGFYRDTVHVQLWN